MLTVQSIPILKDNYVWAIVDSQTKKAVIVDPGDAKPVTKFLRDNNLTLKSILITHHHWDHTNGVEELCETFSTRSLGKGLKDNDSLVMDHFPLKFNVLEIPGHTLDHIAYVTNDGHLFCGDTLFSAGCGRLFEGTADQLFGSLQKLAALPDNTKVYCAHEYTENNLKFAEAVEPKNAAIKKRLKEVKELRSKEQPSLPSTMKQEKATNPFLRCQIPGVIAAAEKFANRSLQKPVEVFAALRKWKDGF